MPRHTSTAYRGTADLRSYDTTEHPASLTKRCGTCKQLRGKAMYYRDASKSDQLCTVCKTCQRKRKRAQQEAKKATPTVDKATEKAPAPVITSNKDNTNRIIKGLKGLQARAYADDGGDMSTLAPRDGYKPDVQAQLKEMQAQKAHDEKYVAKLQDEIADLRDELHDMRTELSERAAVDFTNDDWNELMHDRDEARDRVKELEDEIEVCHEAHNESVFEQERLSQELSSATFKLAQRDLKFSPNVRVTQLETVLTNIAGHIALGMDPALIIKLVKAVL